MKKVVLILVAVFTFVVTYGQIKKYPPKVVIIGIGEKNPTFNEKQYPDLKFYYTPQLVPQNENISETAAAAASLSDGVKILYKGQPEFLSNLWNNVISNNFFMLFDSKSQCYTLGYDLLRQNNDIGNRLCIDKKTLNDHVKDVVKKGKVIKPNKKEIIVQKKKFNKTMVGNELPDFNVVDIDGNSISINSVINNEPTLLVFFNLPKNIDVNKAKTEKKATMKSMFSAASGSSISSLFINLESQVFNNNIREK